MKSRGSRFGASAFGDFTNISSNPYVRPFLVPCLPLADFVVHRRLFPHPFHPNCGKIDQPAVAGLRVPRANRTTTAPDSPPVDSSLPPHSTSPLRIGRIPHPFVPCPSAVTPLAHLPEISIPRYYPIALCHPVHPFPPSRGPSSSLTTSSAEASSCSNRRNGASHRHRNGETFLPFR